MYAFAMIIILCIFTLVRTQRVVPTVDLSYCSGLEHSGSSTPPPIPPYNGDAMSDIQSETPSRLQISTPYFGESYSQAGYSPDQERKTNKDGLTSNSTQKDGYENVSKKGLGKERVYENTRPPRQQIDEGDMNFVDNDAYEIFTAGPPIFEIRGGERGAIRETVQFKI